MFWSPVISQLRAKEPEPVIIKPDRTLLLRQLSRIVWRDCWLVLLPRQSGLGILPKMQQPPSMHQYLASARVPESSVVAWHNGENGDFVGWNIIWFLRTMAIIYISRTLAKKKQTYLNLWNSSFLILIEQIWFKNLKSFSWIICYTLTVFSVSKYW